MEEDEEVLLQNSPLDAYLQEVTDSQFSTYQQFSIEKSFIEESIDNNVTRDSNESKSRNIFNRQKMHDIQKVEALKICKVFFDSNLLSDDDASLLVEIRDDVITKVEALKPDVGEKQPAASNSTSFNIPKIWLLFGLIVLAMSVFVSLSTLVFMLFVMIIVGITVWRYLWTNSIDGVKHYEKIVEFITTFHHIDKLLDQSVTHIKEVEIINSGFQMFRQSRSNEIIGKKGNKCLKLRNVLLDFVIDLFMELRVNQRMLLQTYADELFTVKEEFYSSVPLVKFNELISYKTQEDSLQLPNISIDKLKSMIYLYRALLSEFTLSLIVCFYSLGEDRNNDLLQSIKQMIGVSEKHLDNLENALQKSIQLTFNKKATDGLNRPLKSHTNPIDEKCNKCRLNLYSSLSRLEESESLIHENPSSFDIAALENLFLQFYMNLDNAKACIEDVLNIYKPVKADNNKELSDMEETMQGDTGSNILVPYAELPAEEVGDMMYEGESLDAALRSVEQPVSMEDLEQQLKESRESKRLLRELKTIFAVKDSPAGLLSFPLAKVDESEISNEQEVSIEDELLEMKRRKKKAIVIGDQDFCGEGEENLGDKNYIPETPIGLPVNLLQGLSSFAPVGEEKFGSSDEEDT